MKKFVSFFILFVIVFTMSACSQKADNEVTDGTSTTTTTASTTKAETTETTAKEETTTEQNKQKNTTTKANTGTANKTTTAKKQETTTKANTSPKPQTTTTKPATTKKQETTTQKPTTTKHDHSGLTGNMGKWFNSRAEVDTYYHNVVNGWNTKAQNGEITMEEYAKNCPDGYECWSCAECGKWTGNFYY